MALQIHNVLSRKKELFKPLKEDQVRIYICGVTVYGRSHVGHLRCYLSFDAVIRYLRYRGFNVKYVRNFTDIDDKIIARANEIQSGADGTWRQGEAYVHYDEAQWQERLAEDELIRQSAGEVKQHLTKTVSDHFINIFRNEDFAPFELLQPTSEPRVSEHIPDVIALIEKIIERGFAYVVDGEVYFDVPAYHRATDAYGRLSGRDYTQLVEGARVAPTDAKRSAPDFALWKSSKPGEPSWESPWGPGRPGWHIECSAMSAVELGQPFDIHGGGKDLIFPHHENEIAQSEAATGTQFCRYWMHNGFVTVDGVKMSKSLGNFVSIKDALRIAPPEVWRLLVLGTHYAHPIDFSRSERIENRDCDSAVRGTIDIAFDRLEYFYETLNKLDETIIEQTSIDVSDARKFLKSGEIIDKFHQAMDDDFNTARALAAVGEGMRRANELCDMKAKAIKKFQGGREGWLDSLNQLNAELRQVLDVLGLKCNNPKEKLAMMRDFAAKCRCLDCAQIARKMAERDEARKNKDWERSDALRDELKAMGVELRDSKDGTDWKVIR